jgi:hypothetical protein
LCESPPVKRTSRTHPESPPAHPYKGRIADAVDTSPAIARCRSSTRRTRLTRRACITGRTSQFQTRSGLLFQKGARCTDCGAAGGNTSRTRNYD